MRETTLLPLERKYLEVQYDAITQGYLREFCLDNGFDLSIKFDGTRQDPEKFDFHSTVWFTETEHQLANGTFACDISATPVGFALFGEEENVLVMKIDSDDLVQLRNEYGEQYGMQDTWPDYQPHITVCYNWSGDLPDFDPATVITEPLVADRLNIKTQKRN
jgi:hypothetical protein